MARKKIVESVLSLVDLIPRYALNKSEMDSYKKLCDEENKQIKELMRIDDTLLDEKGNRVAEVDGYVATFSVQQRESMNEEVLLSILDKVLDVREKGIIRSREYVDFDALEKALYNQELPEDVILEMDKAKEVKEVEVLKVSKKKEKK